MENQNRDITSILPKIPKIRIKTACTEMILCNRVHRTCIIPISIESALEEKLYTRKDET